MAQTVKLPDGQIVSFPDEAGESDIAEAIGRDFPQFTPKQSAESGIIGTLGGGTAQTIRAGGAFLDTLQNDTPELQAAAAEQAARVKDPRLAAFEADLAQRRERLGKDPGWLDVIGEVGSAAWKNPAGAGLMTIDQLPNSAAVLAGAGVGAAAGTALGPAGTAVGGIVGGLAGMYTGNLAVEGGSRALEHVSKTGGMSSEDRSRLLYEGAIKAGVITGVDAATFGMTKFLTNASRRAVETATLRVAEQAGVSATEIAARRAADPAFDAAIMSAQKLAMDGATTFGKRALQTGAALGLETIGEGLGEYLGEFAATGEADKMDAVIEAFSSLGQSAAEVGIAKAWNSRNIIAPIAAAKAPEDAIAAAEAALAAPIDTLSSTIDAFKSEWAADAARVPADSAIQMIGMPEQQVAAQPIALPTDGAPTGQPIEVPRAPAGPALLALAEQLAVLPPAEQTKALMRLDAPMRQAVVRAMQPSGIVTPTVLDAGQGQAGIITNEATMAASSVQPVAGAAVTNVPAYTQRAAQEIVSKDPSQEMRPHREVAGRFEVVPIAGQPAQQGGLVPPTLTVPATQQALADEESPATGMPAAPAARPAVPPAPLTAEQNAANQAAADAERSSQPRPIFGQNSQLRSETGPDIKGEKVTRNMRKVLAVMGRITGTKVVFEYAPDSAEGAVPKRGENTIHINTAADINPMQVMGHEVTHVLRDRHAAAWSKVRDALVATMPDKRKGLDDFAANYWGTEQNAGKLAAARAIPDWSARLTPEQKQTLDIGEDTVEAFLLEEMVSDLGGKHWSDEKFWLDVFAKIEKAEGAKAKGIIERMVIAIRETLTKFLAVVRAQKQNDYATISPEQIEKTRDAITSAYAEFIRAERRTEPSGEPHITDHRIGTSDTRSQSAGAESEPQPAAPPVPAATGDEDELSDARSRELASLSTMRPVDTSSVAFKRWFGDSKVVDADGKPLRVYHGTTSNFTKFDLGATDLSPRGDSAGAGFFFTDDAMEAGGYAWTTRQQAGNVMPVYLAIKNPYRIDRDSRHTDRVFVKMTNSKADAKQVRRDLLAEGYDGILTHLGEWVAFHPEQIKSAISNTSDFSKTDPRISYSTQRLFFEAAPNPDDKAATQQWREAGKFGRSRIDERVRKVIVPGLLKDLRITGEIMPQLGGWMDATNPSFALVVSKGDPALAARAIGYVLDQQAMYMLGLERFTGAERTGIIHFDITGKDAHKIYMQVRALDTDKISGHSTVGNEMYIGVPFDRMQALRQSVVEIARTNDLHVSFDEGYGATIKEYGYGIQGERQVARGLRTTARDVNKWREQADTLRSDAAGRRSDRAGVARKSNQRPSYGEGSGEQVVGVHYSRQQRETLSSAYFGTGMKAQERVRVNAAKDPRIKKRLYFYANTGNGIAPEADVGHHAHSVTLNNVYDMDVDPRTLYKTLAEGDPYQSPDQLMNDFESGVIDAGFDGYMTREFGKGGAVVLLGAHSVPVQYEGERARPDVPEMPAPKFSDEQALRRKLAADKTLPAGQLTGLEWMNLFIKRSTEFVPRWLDKDKLYYRDQLIPRAEPARMSESRPATWWYSPLARQADTATMKKAPASGWKSWLKSLAAKGVKPDEIKWSGIEEWLDAQGEMQVTREQVQSYLSEFGVKVETILRGESNPIRPVTDTTQDVEVEDSDIELNIGNWETDDPDEDWLSERASERFDEVVDERVDATWDDIADDIQREARVYVEVRMPDLQADIRREMGDMFPVDDELVEQVARNYAAAQFAGSTWQEYHDEDADFTDEQVQIEATERAFAVLSGDMEALETEARRRARAEIDDDKLLEELTEQERTWYYDDYDSPQTRGITVDGVDGVFYDSTSYGDRNLYYDGHDIPLPRRADDADVEGAIRQYVMEEGLVAGAAGGEFRSTKWEGYTTDKNRAVPGSYREVQLTLPVGAFGMPSTSMAYNVLNPAGEATLSSVSETSARRDAAQLGADYKVVPAETYTARGLVKDFYYTTHWQEANVVGHARWDEHIDSDGKRVMVLQEVQGDWGQQRREGLEAQEKYEAALVARDTAQKRYDDAYDAVKATGVADSWRDADWRDVAMSRDKIDWDSVSTEQAAAITELQTAYAVKEKAIREANQTEADARDTPDAAPFIEKTPQWAGLVLKRMIAHAIEYGFDKVVWTSGAQQVERWRSSLRKQVDTIAWEKTPEGIHIVASQNGRQRTDTRVSETALSDAIGKQMAKQIIADPNQSGEITGDDITISDTGMAGFYDRMLPTIANDILRKFDKDVRVKEIEVHPAIETYRAVDLSKRGGAGFTIEGQKGQFLTSKTFDTMEAAEAAVEKAMAEDAAVKITTQQGFEITDKLRESAAAGMPLFSQRRASAEARKSQARKEWYRSQLSEAVGGLPAKIKTGKEAALWLTSNAGKLQVKKDELTWSGVLDWLATQRSVTGAQIQDWLASNGVRVKDVMLGEESPEYKRLDAELQAMDGEIDRLRKAVYAADVTGRILGVVAPIDMRKFAEGDTQADQKIRQLRFNPEQLDAMLAYGEALNRKNELFEQRAAARGETPKHDSSSLRIPGGKPGTYRELLLVLPGVSRYKVVPHPDVTGSFAIQKPDGSYMLSGPDTLRPGTTLEWESEKMADEGMRFYAKDQFRSSHYPQPNILAHLRFEEMIDADGKRVMFIQEVQGDWPQAGRRVRKELVAAKAKELGITEKAASKLVPASAGFAQPQFTVIVDGNQRGQFSSRAEAETAIRDKPLLAGGTVREVEPKGPPLAPFVTDTSAWVALALKRAISHAVDNGFDRVAWTTGEQQAERYDLSKQVSYIRAIRNSDDTYWVLAVQNREGRGGTGDVLFDKDKLTEAELEATIGKDLTQKIVKQEKRKEHEYTGLDLKVGGDKMDKFYGLPDPTVPVGKDKAGKDLFPIMTVVARSLGATVGTVSLPNPYRPSSSGMTMAEADANLKKAEAAWKPTQPQPGFDITDKMREQAAIGMLLFSERRAAPALDQWLGRSVVRTVMYHGTARDISTFRPQQADAIFLTDDPKFAADFADMSHSWMVNNFWTWMTPEQIQAAKRDAMRMLLQDALPGSSLYNREERLLNQSQQPSQYMRRAVEQFMPSESNIMPLYVRAEHPFDYRNPEHVAAIEREIGTSWMGQEAINGEMHEVSQHIGDLERGDWNAIESEKVQAYIRANHDSFYVRERGVTNLAVFSPNQVKSASGNDGSYSREDNDIRRSTPRSRMSGQPINQTWPDPDMTDWDDFVRKMQDKMVDTKRIVKAIREAGVAISERFDPYMQEILYHGRAASRVKNFADTELRQLLEDMSHRGVVMQDLDDYLWARHAAERNAANARSNPAITDGSGMTDAQAADILAGRAVTINGRTIQLSAQTLRGAAALATRVDAITNRTLDLLVEYKLETQATIDTWKRTYAHYAPLKRDMESDANYSGAFNLGLGTGKGFDIRGAASRRALGSKRSVVDILANVAMQRERAIVRGEKNRVSQAVYGLALTSPNPEFWIPVNPALNKGLSPAALAKVVAELVSIGVNPLDAQNIAREPVERYIDPNTGLEATRINPRLRNRDDVLSVRINGEDRYVMFSNKERAQRMVAGLKNLDADQLGAFLQTAAIGTRWFASVNTQFNPIFGITNGLRDLSTGMLNLSSTPLSANRAEIARNAFSALKGIYLDLRDHRAGRQPTSQWAQLFEQFALDGGQTGYRDMFQNSKARADEIAKELKHAGKGKQWITGGEKHSAVFGWLSDYNTAVENAVRLSAYKAALDKGMTREAAAALAKNLTVNFNKKGLAATQTGALYAFFNAAVQGTARMAETMTTDGKLNSVGQKIVYGGIVLGVMQATLGMLAGWDDEEPPQYLREKNFLIPIPGSDKYLSIPMPLGFHVIPSVGRIATEWMMSGFKDPGKRLTRLAGVLLDAFNPIGGTGSIGQMISPTITDPIIALGENKDWTGKPVFKEDFSKMQPTPGWTRTKDTASPISRWLSYAMNYATGGGKYEIGLLSPTPDQIDYLVGQATGGVGREILKTAQYVGAKVTGEEMPLYKTPLGVGRFVGETKGQASETSRFYDNLRRIGEHKSALENMKDARDGDALLRYLERHPDARLVQTADKAQREIGYLRRQKRELIEKGASKERVRIVEDRITGLTARYNEKLATKK